MTWNKISENIALNGKGSKYDNQFSKLSSVWGNLHGSLSEDAKDYTVEDIEKLPDTFTKLIQYLDAAFKLIDIDKIKIALT